MLFKDVIGHNELKSNLIQEIEHDKISHAQLFLGAEGSGNLAMALAFVQYLYCSNREEQEACGQCSACKRVAKLEHPDVHFSFPTVLSIERVSDPLMGAWRAAVLKNPYLSINDWIHQMDPKGRKPTISVSESEQIVKKLSLKSFEGGYKVMIIWMAEWMQTATANKLLKIIEEPPENTIFLLIANNQEAILPTILSRTQLVKIPQADNEELASALVERQGLSEEQSKSISAMAQGNVNKAMNLARNQDQKNHLLEAFIKLMRVSYKKNVRGMIDWSHEMADTGRETQKSFIDYALYMMRSSIIKNYHADLVDNIPDEEAQFLNNFARFITGNNIGEIHDLFSDTHYHIDRNANPKIAFTDTSFQLMKLLNKA